MYRIYLLCSFSFAIYFPISYAASNNSMLKQQVIQQEQQEQARQSLLSTKGNDVYSQVAPSGNDQVNFNGETPCFNIVRVNLIQDELIPAWASLHDLVDQVKGQCVGIRGIQQLVTVLQNRLIASGYITTRVLVPDQDIRLGHLTLEVLSGKIGRIALSKESDSYVSLWNSLPFKQGELLDLRSVEQALENLQRIPSVDANIKLLPGDTDGETDILIERTQSKSWRLGAWLDDAGSKHNGRYQGSLALYLDNPTSLNDIFYLSSGRALQNNQQKGSQNDSVYYSVPWGFWALDLYAGRSEYHQAVVGLWENYQYRSKNRNLSLQVNRLLHRGAEQKTTLSGQLVKRNSNYYLNDTEIEIQQRDVTSWKTTLQHTHYFNDSILDASLSYQQATRLSGTQPLVGTGSDGVQSKNRIITSNINLAVPFELFNQSMSYQTRYVHQLSPDALASQDLFAIGNRWSVRGFDGEYNLAAERGWYLQNDLNLNLPIPNQQLYLGVDYGQVSGNGVSTKSGKLVGGVVGLRGTKWGTRYEVFAGTPLSKPDEFTSSPLTLGFNLQWQY